MINYHLLDVNLNLLNYFLHNVRVMWVIRFTWKLIFFLTNENVKKRKKIINFYRNKFQAVLIDIYIIYVNVTIE